MVGADVIAGLVLAAGASTRMGAVKQALPYAGSTVLGTVVAAALASSLDEVVVVTGYHADEVEALLPDAVRVVRNPEPERGNHSSLLHGLAETAAAQAVVMMLGDQPQVDSAVVDRMAAVWRERRPWAAVAEYRGIPGHPFLLSAACAASIPSWAGPRPMWRRLVTDRDSRVARVAFDREAPIDVDTPEDYARLTG